MTPDDMTPDDNSSRPDPGSINKLLQVPPVLLTLTAALLTVFLIAGLLGNGFSIIVLRRMPRPWNANIVFILNLCAFDFLFCLIVLPFEISRFAHGKWLFGEGWVCTLYSVVKYLNIGISMTLIGLIAVNRLMLVASSRFYARVYRTGCVYAQVVGVCLYTFVWLCPTLFGVWGRFGFSPQLQTCTISSVDGVSAKSTLFIIAFVIPSVFIGLCYTGIVLVLARSSRRLRRYNVGTASKTSRPGGNTSRIWSSSECRVAKLGAAVFAVFILSTLPSTIAKVADPYSDYPVAHTIGYIMLYASPWVNPILYIVMNRQYRHVCQSMGCRVKRRWSWIHGRSGMNTASPHQIGQRSPYSSPTDLTAADVERNQTALVSSAEEPTQHRVDDDADVVDSIEAGECALTSMETYQDSVRPSADYGVIKTKVIQAEAGESTEVLTKDKSLASTNM